MRAPFFFAFFGDGAILWCESVLIGLFVFFGGKFG